MWAARVVCYGFDLGEEIGFQLLRDEYNARCRPEWSEAELRHKCNDAVYPGGFNYSRGWLLEADRPDWKESPRIVIGSTASESPSIGGDDSSAPPPPNDADGESTPQDNPRSYYRPPLAQKALIRINNAFDQMTNQLVYALSEDTELYARGGQLVRVVVEPEVTVKNFIFPAGPRILPVTIPTLYEHASYVSRWEIYKGEQAGYQQCDPLMMVVTAARDRGVWPKQQRLTALVDHPFMLADGSIVAEPGYHAGTGVRYESSHPVHLDVPESPTLADAKCAAALLLHVVCNFPFETESDRAAWLASLLTPLVRYAHSGQTPMLLFDANTPGSGKTKLCQIISVITRGMEFATNSYPSTDDELRKKITSLLERGCSMFLLDNIDPNIQIGGPVFDMLLTSSIWEDRLLGVNKIATLPNTAAMYGTGNNVRVKGDTLRRVLHTRIKAQDERPEERTDFVHPKLLEWVQDNRPRLLAAAFTMLRAYHAAGRPDMHLPRWGGFDSWSDIIRNTIAWVGLTDPWLTREKLRENNGDEQLNALREFYKLWVLFDPAYNGITAGKIVKWVDDSNNDEAVETLAVMVGAKPPHEKHDRRTHKLGTLFNSNKERKLGSFTVYVAGMHGGSKRWSIRTETHPPTPPGKATQNKNDGGGGGSGGGDSHSYAGAQRNDIGVQGHAYAHAHEGVQNTPTTPHTPTKNNETTVPQTTNQLTPDVPLSRSSASYDALRREDVGGRVPSKGEPNILDDDDLEEINS